MYMLIYVDDIIIAGSRRSFVDQLLVQLHDAFDVKDLGPLTYFLGVEVQPIVNGIALTQRKYATDLLRRANMQNCKSVATPMSPADRLSKTSGVPLAGNDVFLYRSTLGALQYLCLTCPDIAFAVNKTCQFLQSPTNVHWAAVKRILRYVQGTLDLGLSLHWSSSTELSIYSDAD